MQLYMNDRKVEQVDDDDNFGLTVSAKCNNCGSKRSVHDVEPQSYVRYLRGGVFIQDAFPDLSSDDREVIMSHRTGYFLCDQHW